MKFSAVSAVETEHRSQTEGDRQIGVDRHQDHCADQAADDLHLMGNAADRHCGKRCPAELAAGLGPEEGNAEDDVDQDARPLSDGGRDREADRRNRSQHLRSEDQSAEAAQQGRRYIKILDTLDILSEEYTHQQQDAQIPQII